MAHLKKSKVYLKNKSGGILVEIALLLGIFLPLFSVLIKINLITFEKWAQTFQGAWVP